MNPYKHTQIGYLMLVVTLAVLAFFVWVYTMALNEVPAVDSGPNLAVSAVMFFVIFILLSFAKLNVSIDEKYLKVKFGYGIFKKSFLVDEIVSAKIVKNKWYYGWGVRLWFWPRMFIYNVSGFDAVEIKMTNGKIYRIGTNQPQQLELEINKQLK
ncbi:MAG: hypothetical protein KBB86_01785 [Candidatus Pacebacteria bacterium]|nr:hypothetical protein [Candidatus Paceibacterota bacterium]